MKRVFFIMFFVSFTISLFATNTIAIEIDSVYINKTGLIGIDVIGYNRDTKKFLINVTEEEKAFLKIPYREKKIPTEIKGEYLNTNQIYDSLYSLHNNYPLLTKIDTIGYSAEGRPLLIFFIGKEENNPALLLMGCHHAREVQTPGMVLFFIDSLLQSSSNIEIENLLDNVSIYAIPLVNPDGYDYALTTDDYWRKNRRFLEQFSSYGVDLNRNYNGTCNGEIRSSWGSMISSSATSLNPFSNIYCGTMPFSETETQAIRDFIINHSEIKISLSYHSYGELVIFPWGSLNEKPPHYDELNYIASQIASRIIGWDGDPYISEQSVSLYPSTGDSDDWIYGYTTYSLGRTVLPFTIECDNVFRPDTETLDSLYKLNFPGILYAANYVESLDITNIPIVDSIFAEKTEDTLDIYFTDNQVSDIYILKEWIDYKKIFDGGEFGISNWTRENFYITTNSYEGDSVFYTGSANYLISSITSVLPLFSDTISFYIKYNLGQESVFLFEISKDGKSFLPISEQTVFTEGFSDWKRITVSLPDTNGYYIRFRYSSALKDSGVYIDNISSVPIADSIFIPYEEGITENKASISYPKRNTVIGVSGYNNFGLGPWRMVKIIGTDTAEVDTFDIENTITNSTIAIEIPEGREDINVLICDITGRIVETLSFPYYNKKIFIDMNDKPKGMYFVIIEKGNLNRVYKILKIAGG